MKQFLQHLLPEACGENILPRVLKRSLSQSTSTVPERSRELDFPVLS